MTDKSRRDAPRARVEKPAGDRGFDLDRALRSIVTIQSSIPEDAYTAQTSGRAADRQRGGHPRQRPRADDRLSHHRSGNDLDRRRRRPRRPRPRARDRSGERVRPGAGPRRLDCPPLEFGRSGEACARRPGDRRGGRGDQGGARVHCGEAGVRGILGVFPRGGDFHCAGPPFLGRRGSHRRQRAASRRRLAARRTTDRARRPARHQYVRADRPPAAGSRGSSEFGRVNKPARPWLGIYSAESNGEVVVAALADRGPAAGAGLRRGDTLASVRGAEIADLSDFYRKVWRCGEAGVEVPVEIIRDGRALGFRIKSADRTGFLKRPRLQ